MAGAEGLCACKGIRTCRLCEERGGKVSQIVDQESLRAFWYCQACQKAWEHSKAEQHPNHHGNHVSFPGIFLKEQFLTEAEESWLVEEIDKTDYVDSQSGRRKQDYGPKVNFKRKKLKTDVFTGLPSFSKELYERMKQVDMLSDFVPVEQCHLEYVPERGSAIDPHFDDFWLWGERLVTLNLLSDSVLCFTSADSPGVEVHVKMTRGSLLVVYGEARNVWKHAIHRTDISSRRIAVTLRELSAEFQEGGNRHSDGQKLIDIALTFQGRAVGSAPTPVES